MSHPKVVSGPSLPQVYINIALPPILAGATLSYVDLDLDTGVNRDFSYVTYDEDEFLSHCDLWRYPPDVCERARATFEDLLSRVQRRDPLFREWEHYWPLVPEHFATGTGAALFPTIEATAQGYERQRGAVGTQGEMATPDP